MKNLLKNRYGQVRSGWIILVVMAAFYGLSYLATELFISVVRQALIAKGEINPATGYYGPVVDFWEMILLPIILQVLTDAVMIAVPVVVWRCIIKQSIGKMGMSSVKEGQKEGLMGMLIGFINCTLIFVILILFGQARVDSWKPAFTMLQASWILVFVVVAFAEEMLNRGFFMAVLRRTRNIYVIMLVPSCIFGCIHLMNPGVTVFSILNIVLVGVLFSYIFVKSGNIWMCIGYHFTWNTFQGVIYGMPVSGLGVKGMITTTFTSDTVLNGGGFGIEGGILTTLVTVLAFLFLKYYYRDSKYDFISDTKGGQTSV